MKRLWTYWLLTYAELTYWLVGNTPEGHQFDLARAWSGLDDHARVIRHLRAGLKYYDNPRMRWHLGRHLACVGEWQQAAEEYAQVAAVIRQPAVLLDQAEAELRLGNRVRAIEIIGAVDRDHAPLAGALKTLRDQLAEACIAAY